MSHLFKQNGKMTPSSTKSKDRATLTCIQAAGRICHTSFFILLPKITRSWIPPVLRARNLIIYYAFKFELPNSGCSLSASAAYPVVFRVIIRSELCLNLWFYFCKFCERNWDWDVYKRNQWKEDDKICEMSLAYVQSKRLKVSTKKPLPLLSVTSLNDTFCTFFNRSKNVLYISRSKLDLYLSIFYATRSVPTKLLDKFTWAISSKELKMYFLASCDFILVSLSCSLPVCQKQRKKFFTVHMLN